VLQAESRGYRYELVPPIVVDVLPGRPVHAPSQHREVILSRL
jgi:hypothetical protein